MAAQATTAKITRDHSFDRMLIHSLSDKSSYGGLNREPPMALGMLLESGKAGLSSGPSCSSIGQLLLHTFKSFDHLRLYAAHASVKHMPLDVELCARPAHCSDSHILVP